MEIQMWNTLLPLAGWLPPVPSRLVKTVVRLRGRYRGQLPAYVVCHTLVAVAKVIMRYW